jgi:hypothetical protein
MNYHLFDGDETGAAVAACCRALTCEHKSFHQQTRHMKNEEWTLTTDNVRSPTDSLLPSEHFGAMRRLRLSGEQRLMLAVLVDAFNVLRSWHDGSSGRCYFAEAAQWVNTRETGHLFSFDSVCDALEINAELLRSRLRRLFVRPTNSARRPLLRVCHLQRIESRRTDQ